MLAGRTGRYGWWIFLPNSLAKSAAASEDQKEECREEEMVMAEVQGKPQSPSECPSWRRRGVEEDGLVFEKDEWKRERRVGSAPSGHESESMRRT